MSEWSAEAIRRVRRQLGLSREALARHLGVGIQDVLGLEADRRLPARREISQLEALKFIADEHRAVAQKDAGADAVRPLSGADCLNCEQVDQELLRCFAVEVN